MAPKKTTLNELGQMLTHVVEHMATKGDIAELKADIAGIRSELRDIKARLKQIEAAVEDHAGHSKEIDHALERIAAFGANFDFYLTHQIPSPQYNARWRIYYPEGL